MNAIELLVHDHETVKKLLNELSETTERALKKRSELLGRLELELVLHTAIEEDIFYPAIRESGGKEELKMYYEARRNTARWIPWSFPTSSAPARIPCSSPAGSRCSRNSSNTTSRRKRANYSRAPGNCSTPPPSSNSARPCSSTRKS